MASPPTSKLRFLDTSGTESTGPREWARSLVEVLVPPERLEQIRLLRQGEPMQLFAQPLGGSTRVLAEWPRSNTGRYRLRLEDGAMVEELEVGVAPEKISQSAYGRVIDELQTALPASVALGLQKVGALEGLELRSPGESTLAQELSRLRRAVKGSSGTIGLATTLAAIARDPQRVLVKTEQWVESARVRRLEPVGLISAVREPNNVDPATGLLRQAPDVRVEHTLDVYENRLLRSYHDQVAGRLRRLAATFAARGTLGALLEVEKLLEALARARRTAAFLDEIGLLQQAPTRATMVLLKRPEYRSLLKSYLHFRRSPFVRLDDPALEAPLENLPHLYELWGTLHVISALLEIAEVCGYRVVRQQLVGYLDGGVYLSVFTGGEAAVELRSPVTGDVALLTPQRLYGKSSPTLRSISFSQIPDISVEVRRRGQPARLYLFDPKYKLQSEEGAEPGDGRPKKIDIDTMHAYRDAIRNPAGERVVSSAAILYPGPDVRYGDGIEAVSARPLEPGCLKKRLRALFTEALLTSDATAAGAPNQHP